MFDHSCQPGALFSLILSFVYYINLWRNYELFLSVLYTIILNIGELPFAVWSTLCWMNPINFLSLGLLK
jgi:hypothetical protein